LLLAYATLRPSRAAAQELPAPPANDSLVVSVITFGPGNEVFERFGHIAIRVHDITTGVDSAYNWGMFDFAQPHFLVNFLTGDTRYWMQGYPTLPMVAAYKQLGRAVWEQTLALTALEKAALRRHIMTNALEQNKYYRYDYYRDNCSTRVRDALDYVLHGELKRSVDAQEHGVSYRTETLRLAVAYPATSLAMDFVLGRPADEIISAWDEMFIPMRLRDLIRGARVRHTDGSRGRLVLSERQLVVDERYAESDHHPDLLAPALLAGSLFTALVLIIGFFSGRSAAARIAFAVVGGTWHGLVGFAGLLAMCAGLFTKHVFMGQNINWFLATPASLALMVLLPLAVRRGAPPRVVSTARGLTAITAGAAIFTVVLRAFPAFTQDSLPIIVLLLPGHVAVAAELWRLTRERKEDQDSWSNKR
jgi:hypothetical protein